MTYTVVFARSAERDLASVPSRVLPAVIGLAFGDLAENPRPVGKPLHRELAGTYSARRGDYRLLYLIDDERATVVIVRVAHRADVYRPG